MPLRFICSYFFLVICLKIVLLDLKAMKAIKTQLATGPQGENTPQDNPKNGPHSQITAQQ